ncbi:MAG: hypothetical protein AAGK97_13665 [Bacteroidota bacterium]
MSRLTLFTLIFLFNASVNGQMVPNLWHDNLELKLTTPTWSERMIHVIEIEDGKEITYPLSKVETLSNNNKRITLFNRTGDKMESNTTQWIDPLTQVYKTKDGDKEVKKYDAKGRLVSEVWTFSFGSKDDKKFYYNNDKLFKITFDEDGEFLMESLIYEDDRLNHILSIDEDGNELMRREWHYNDAGNIEKILRIQDEKINKTESYFYDESDKLIRKEEAKVNRLFGGHMPPEVCIYKYYDNGRQKEEHCITYMNEAKEELKNESITILDESGLVIKEIYKDHEEGTEEISEYSYRYNN